MTRVVVMWDYPTGRNKGYGFVSFATQQVRIMAWGLPGLLPAEAAHSAGAGAPLQLLMRGGGSLRGRGIERAGSAQHASPASSPAGSVPSSLAPAPVT